MKKLILCAAVILGFTCAASADTLWYNGDMNDFSDLNNGVNIRYGASPIVYDDFIVPESGWIVDTVWTNDALRYFTPTQAFWEIRSGVSEGNGGTVVASGTNDVTLSATGRDRGVSYPEYSVTVSGLNIPLSAGTYWLAVAPIGTGDDERSHLTTTSGLNAVGLPAGNNSNAFWTGDYFVYDVGLVPVNFEPTTFSSSLRTDFSMGVGGKVAPEPVSCLLFLTGAGVLVVVKRRKR